MRSALVSRLRKMTTRRGRAPPYHGTVIQDEGIAAIAEAADDERAVAERSGARAVVVAVEPAPAALISGGQRSVVFGLAAVLFVAVAVFALVA